MGESENVSMAGTTEEPENVQWLVKIATKAERRQEHPIQMAPPTLRQVKTNDTYFVPKVVSLGPYHHQKGRPPRPIDYLKVDAVRWFISHCLQRSDYSGDEVRTKHEEFVTKASPAKAFEARDWYDPDNENIKQLKDEDFTVMMFVDGCFILYVVYKWLHERYTDHIHQPFILSDMFLLENHIPYRVLKSLVNLMPEPKANLEEKDIEKFIKLFILEHAFLDRWSSPSRMQGRRFGMMTGTRSTSETIEKDYLHLLDILWTNLIAGPITTSQRRPNLIAVPITIFERLPDDDRHDDRHYVRSIMELKAKGIKIHKSRFNNLSEIKFKEGIIHGHLWLPQMIINDRTRTQLLNLIAYEMCPRFPSEQREITSSRVITSYVCFLDCLIDHADDVKELRSKGILRNHLGSDEEVAKLFNEVATNSIPDPRVYEDTLKKIQKHCQKRSKVWVAEMWYNHFRSPWTLISLTAAIFFLFLSVVQTIFTVW